jgi:3-methyladenine DNA glycosylase AlkD
MLQGMVIGLLNEDIEVVLEQVKKFVPKINNWSVCDTFCNGLKIIKEHKSYVWEFLKPYYESNDAYDIRFAVVTMLFFYIEEEYIEKMFSIFDSIHHSNYYVKMAVAWAISMCYVNLPEQTMSYLKNNHLDDDTYNKALQKIRESLKVDKRTKEIIKAMKR